jgi:hypothetical protein
LFIIVDEILLLRVSIIVSLLFIFIRFDFLATLDAVNSSLDDIPSFFACTADRQCEFLALFAIVKIVHPRKARDQPDKYQ